MKSQAKLLNYTPSVDENKFFAVWSQHYYEIMKLAHPYLASSSTILEVGYGYGVLAKCLKTYDTSVTSIEHPSRSDTLSGTFIDDTFKSGIHLVLSDILKPLPFQPRSFDLIFVCDVIEHIDPSYAQTCLEKFRDLLRPNGKIILSTPNLRRWGKLIEFIKGRSINPPLIVTQYGETYDHIREFLPSEIEGISSAIQMQVEKTRFWHLPFFDPKYEISTKFVGRLFPSLLDEFGMVLSSCNQKLSS